MGSYLIRLILIFSRYKRNKYIMTKSILTTHVGSLPRSQKVVDLIFAKENKQDFCQQEFDQVMSAHVDNSPWCQLDRVHSVCTQRYRIFRSRGLPLPLPVEKDVVVGRCFIDPCPPRRLNLLLCVRQWWPLRKSRHRHYLPSNLRPNNTSGYNIFISDYFRSDTFKVRNWCTEY